MKNKIKILCFDLDNVICTTTGNNYKKSKPKKKVIKFINNLYDHGYYIKLFTARFMGRNNQSIIKAKKLGLKLTENQLKNWNIKYHELIFGKPSYDIFVDDKNYDFDRNWIKKFKKKLNLKNKL